MNIVFLMGGKNDSRPGSDYPIYMAEVHNHLILENQINYVQDAAPEHVIFCVRKHDIEQYHVDFIARALTDNAVIVPMCGQTKGAICSALLACSYIDNNEELVLCSVDDCVDQPLREILQNFREQQCDAGIVTFRSVHPRYSFVKTDENGAVCEFSEKKPISRNALASIYYFSKGSDFVACAKDVIRKDNTINEKFYISQTLNEMILKQKKITVHHIDNQFFHPMKTEMQLASYLKKLENALESV